MKKYNFIRKRNEEEQFGRKVYLAIPDTLIKTMKLSDCYGDYGQKVDTYTAGDSVMILSKKARALANRIARRNDCNYRFPLNAFVSAYDYSDIYDELFGEIQSLKLGKDWEDCSVEVEGFTYWNGSNHKSVVVSPEEFSNYELLDDEELEKELNEAIENKEYHSESYGRRFYSFGEWTICESAWQGDFESYAITGEPGDEGEPDI